MPAAVSEDTAALLDEVKKGKPRRYLMICKGPSVVYLAVFKKGNPETLLTAAKKQGFRGESYVGVVDGSGQNLSFKLSIADGHEKPPVKDLALKAFLADSAGCKAKPAIEIVPSLDPIDDEGGEGAAAAVTPEVAKARIKERLGQLNAAIKDLVAARPDQRAAVLDLLKQTKAYADGFVEMTPDAGLAALAKLEALLAQPAPVATAAPKTGGATGDPRAAWRGALDEAQKQVATLAAEISAHEGDECQRLARSIADAVAARFGDRLDAALTIVAESGDRTEYGAAVEEHKSLLKSDPLLAMIDANPFGVKLAVRATLVKGLIAVEQGAKKATA
ncbi:MAG: hypothetical protein ACRCT8_16975 [Lacipirellulaceae bacterium]